MEVHIEVPQKPVPRTNAAGRADSGKKRKTLGTPQPEFHGRGGITPSSRIRRPSMGSCAHLLPKMVPKRSLRALGKPAGAGRKGRASSLYERTVRAQRGKGVGGRRRQKRHRSVRPSAELTILIRSDRTDAHQDHLMSDTTPGSSLLSTRLRKTAPRRSHLTRAPAASPNRWSAWGNKHAERLLTLVGRGSHGRRRLEEGRRPRRVQEAGPGGLHGTSRRVRRRPGARVGVGPR